MMRWAEAHRRTAIIAFALPSFVLLGLPWALTGGALLLAIPVSFAFGLAIGLVVRWFLNAIRRESALDLPTRRMISTALERGQAVTNPAYAKMTAEMAASQRRARNILFPSVPGALLVFQTLYLLHIGRSVRDSVFDLKGLGVVAFSGLTVLYPWWAWNTRLRRAEELNRRLSERTGEG
jgi:hypothetical protein